MLRSLSIMLVAISVTAASNSPADAQSPLSKGLGKQWGDKCVAGSGTSLGPKEQCCSTEMRTAAPCKDDVSGSCPAARDICLDTVRSKFQPGYQAAKEKAASERAAQEKIDKAKLDEEVKQIKANQEKAAQEEAAREKAAREKAAQDKAAKDKADKEADDKMRAAADKAAQEKVNEATKKGAAEAEKGAKAIANKVAATPHVEQVPTVDAQKLCSDLPKLEGAWTPDKNFRVDGGGKCSRAFNCAAKTTPTIPGVCKEVPKAQIVSHGTCSNGTCTACTTSSPSDKCTVSFAKR